MLRSQATVPLSEFLRLGANAARLRNCPLRALDDLGSTRPVGLDMKVQRLDVRRGRAYPPDGRRRPAPVHGRDERSLCWQPSIVRARN